MTPLSSRRCVIGRQPSSGPNRVIAVDTNVLLRYLLQPRDSRNPEWQNVAATQLIDRTERVFISDVVVAELEWVLEAVFSVERQDIAELVAALANNRRFQFEDWQALQRALMDYREYPGADLSDCLIVRRSVSCGASSLYTFEGEGKLGAVPGVTTLRRPAEH